MLFHLSIVARNPKQVTKVLAELMGGESQPFPAVAKAHIAFANDVLGTAIEVYPLNTVLEQGKKDQSVLFAESDDSSYPRSVHFAIKTHLSLEQVLAIGAREGWRTLPCSRGNFHVVELWIENEFLMELITPDKAQEAVDFHNSRSWAKAITAFHPAGLA